MPNISAVVTKTTYDLIKKMETTEGISISKICAMLIERGLLYAHEQEKYLLLKKNQVEQRRVLSRILNISSEIFLQLNDEQGHFKGDANEVLRKIHLQAKEKICDN